MISTLFHCTCCKSPNGDDVATKDRHFESFESKYSFKLLLLASAELVSMRLRTDILNLLSQNILLNYFC